MGVRAEVSEVAEFYRKFPDFSDYNWNLILKDDNEVGMVVFLQPDNLFVGTCSFQGVQKENLELGYDIAKELRGKGIGTRMVGALFQLAHKHFPEREIFVRVREDNSASRRVAEKNGAVFIKMDDPPEVIALQTLLEHNDDPTRAEEARAITIMAKRNDVSEAQIRVELQEAINASFRCNDSHVQAQWAECEFAGSEPTPGEFIIWLAKKVNARINHSLDKSH